MVAGHLRRGSEGEKVAARFLKKKGYKIITANWRARGGELDMVASKGRDLVFVEVKARTAGGLGDPAESVTPEKRRRLTSAAREYLTKHDLWSSRCRFDVVLVTYAADGDTSPEIEHIENAFDFSDALGRGHPSWQPW